MKTVTHRQKEVLEFIRLRAESNQMPPTLREISEHFGWTSPSAAQEHVTALRKKGLLEPRKRAARSLRVVGQARKHVLGIPLMDTDSCVPGEITTDRLIFVESVHQETQFPPRHFALKLTTDAMRAHHILHGDIVVLARQVPPQPGEVVATVVDGRYALKVYTPESQYPVHGVQRMLFRPFPAGDGEKVEAAGMVQEVKYAGSVGA